MMGVRQVESMVDRLNRVLKKWEGGGGGSTYPPRATAAEGPMGEKRRRVKPVASLGRHTTSRQTSPQAWLGGS